MVASVTPSFTRAIISHLDAFDIQVDDDLMAQIEASNANERLPMALQDALWQFLADKHQPNLGLSIGLAMKPESFDTLGFLLLTSPSLAVAVESLINYSPLIGEGGKFHKANNKQRWTVAYQPFFSVAVALRVEAIFASIVTGARWVAGKNITPVAVHFRHSASADPALYQQVFGDADIVFAAEQNCIVYSDSDWHFKQKSINPAVQKQMLELANYQLGQLQTTSVIDKVESLLTHQPWLSRAQIAASLAMSERTLSRKLAASGNTFKALAQSIKMTIAEQRVMNSDTTQAELADYLGYHDESAFSKAFKRWSGKSFREFKRVNGTY
ncbi:MAG: AraC family transcriptional regulator ligand-binding domain-containing protein [Kangiellaceae bacterium]|jgi:AraC-like DNA-binding protein|nr:AraC family transcriptional regulator ligand-binding domain-containing protein [Kangiellaceae bacterium]